MRMIMNLVCFFALISISTSAEFHIDQSKKNSIKFISDAPIEEFEGNTSKIDGYIASKDENMFGAEVYFEVDLTSVETGIGLRDRHMRDNYLHTNKYPMAEFKGKIVKFEKSGNNYDVSVEGTIKIHGIEKKVKIDGTMQKTENGFLVETKFIVKLSDHKIEIPQIMFSKINEDMDLRLSFYIKKVS